ncbi:TetR/AcrR family transcriptional regulator [Nocardioides panacihumi]|uniref:TetR/AcrR family transcriptional regulator n=1 Tax=Nocardioides panacihumi TaxID=400774 RepID=A0ABN2QHI8_9ACTN
MARTTVARRPNAGTKGVPRADREEQIVLAATAVFGSQGFAATSVADVAERAGISKPLIYNYFGSKEGLFTACLHRAGAMLAEEMERIARGDAVGLERALRTLEGIFTLLEPQPWIWRLFFDPTIPRGEERIAAEIAHYTDRITALADEGVREMMRLAGADDPLDVSALTSAWLSVADSLVSWWLDHPEETPASMTARCLRLFHVVLGAPLPSALTAD